MQLRPSFLFFLSFCRTFSTLRSKAWQTWRFTLECKLVWTKGRKRSSTHRKSHARRHWPWKPKVVRVLYSWKVIAGKCIFLAIPGLRCSNVRFCCGCVCQFRWLQDCRCWWPWTFRRWKKPHWRELRQYSVSIQNSTWTWLVSHILPSTWGRKAGCGYRTRPISCNWLGRWFLLQWRWLHKDQREWLMWGFTWQYRGWSRRVFTVTWTACITCTQEEDRWLMWAGSSGIQ